MVYSQNTSKLFIKSVPIGKKHRPIPSSDKIDYKCDMGNTGKSFVKIYKKITES